MCGGGKETGAYGKAMTHGQMRRKQQDGCGVRAGALRAVTLPTLNGVDLADGIADSAAEAGQPGCGPLHLGHGALEPGLEAGGRTRS